MARNDCAENVERCADILRIIQFVTHSTECVVGCALIFFCVFGLAIFEINSRMFTE